MDAAAERELIQRCRDGSEGAFRQLVERYQSPLFAALRTSDAEPAQVEALAHEVFLRVYRGLPYLSGQVDVPGWLQKIVLGLAGRSVDIKASAQGPVPQGFASRVVRSARGDWLRSEERFDWWFNAGMGVAVTFIGVGLWVVLSTSGFTGVFEEFVRQMTGG